MATRRLLTMSALVSLATLPVLWFVLSAFLTPRVVVVLGEAPAPAYKAVVVEALLSWRLLPARPAVGAVLSMAANLASFVVGWPML